MTLADFITGQDDAQAIRDLNGFSRTVGRVGNFVLTSGAPVRVLSAE